MKIKNGGMLLLVLGSMAMMAIITGLQTKAVPPITGGEIYGIAVDANGNVIVTGSVSQGDTTAIVTQKYDSNGKLLWEKSYQKENIATNVGEAVAIDADGNIYVGGIVGAGFTSSELSSLFTNYIILKYDSNGNLLWHKEYDKHFADLLRDIAIDNNGNVYVTGVTIQVDLTGGQPTNLNFWTIKVDGVTGNIIAEDEYDRGGTDAAFGMDVRGNNVVVVGGTEENNITKFVVVKYDTNLNKKWDKLYGENAAATDAAIFSDGSIVVSGNKGTNFWTLMLNSNGNEKWDKTDGTAYNDYSLGIGIDGNENIIIGNHIMEGSTPKWHIVKYSKSGNVIWDKTYDIEGAIRSIAIYNNDIIAGGYKIVGGVNRYFVAKFAENGSEIWEGYSFTPTFVNITPCWQKVNVNDTFVVNVTVMPSVAIAGVQFDLSFNASLLEVVSVEEGNLFNGYSTFFINGSIDNTNGKINDVYGAIIVPGGNVSNAGTFAKITFRAKKEGLSYLNLSDVVVGNVTANPVAIKINNGSVEIVAHRWDLNHDNTINVLDLIIIAQHFGSHEGDTNYAREADLNNDGVINVLDLIVVAQHFGETY